MKKVGENINFFQSQGLSYLSLTGRLSKADQIIKIQEFIRPKFVKAIIATCNIQGKKVPKELLGPVPESAIRFDKSVNGIYFGAEFTDIRLDMCLVASKAAGKSRYWFQTTASQRTLEDGNIVLVEDLIAGAESEESSE